MAVGTGSAIGIVGLGKMGLRMAVRLIGGGFNVCGHDTGAAAMAAAERAGVHVLPDAAAVAAHAQRVLVMVGFERDVDAVLFGEKGVCAGARAGLPVAIGATVSPHYMRKLASRAPGLALLDAPTARGEVAAEKGALLLFAGGDPAVLEDFRPAFALLADEIHHLGGLGTGQAAKAANNFLLWTCLAGTVEALDFGESQGVDRAVMRAALANSSGANWAMETRADERHAMWAEKDMMTLLAEADRARLAMPLAGTVKEAIKAFKIARNLPMPQETR